MTVIDESNTFHWNLYIVFTGVSDSVHWGCVYPSMHCGRHRSWADTLRADTPRADTPRADTPLGRHPPQVDTSHPQQTATAADGTHPTEVHSCYRDLFYSRKLSGNKDNKECSSLFVSNYQGYHKTGIPIGGLPTGKEFRWEACNYMYWSYDLSYCVRLGVEGRAPPSSF